MEPGNPDRPSFEINSWGELVLGTDALAEHVTEAFKRGRKEDLDLHQLAGLQSQENKEAWDFMKPIVLTIAGHRPNDISLFTPKGPSDGKGPHDPYTLYL